MAHMSPRGAWGSSGMGYAGHGAGYGGGYAGGGMGYAGHGAGVYGGGADCGTACCAGATAAMGCGPACGAGCAEATGCGSGVGGGSGCCGAGAGGATILSYVGAGGDYAQETTYRYVGAGAGEFGVLRIPGRGPNCCLFLLIPGLLSLLLLPLLLFSLAPGSTTTTTTTTTPFVPPSTPPPDTTTTTKKTTTTRRPPPPPPPPPPEAQDEQQEDQDEPDEQDEEEQDEPEEEEEDNDAEEQQELPEEFMIDPEGAIVDDDLMKFQSQQKKQGRSGKGNKIYSMDRGRYVKAMLPKGGDAKGGKIALDATLRNAVVYQKMRKEEAIRKNTPPDQLRNVYVERSDIWVKKMARKAGALVVFVVDASGSMALNRMQNAKGAVLRLLENAYQNRDQVALIPCRGISADVLVPPTSSVSRASSSMQVLPCGGGTPLAHALQQAILLGTNALKTSDVGSVCIVSITDGRANVPLAVSEGDEMALDENGRMKKIPKEELQEEVFVMADRIRAMGFKFLLIDTENKYVSSGIAKKVSDRADGRYYYLPRADDKAIANIAGDAINELRSR